MAAKVQIRSSGTEFSVESSKTILKAALRSGLSLKYSCNNGTCGDCKARVVAGRPGEMLPHDYVLKDAEKAQGTVLLCCAKADSDMVIEATEAGGADEIPSTRIATTVHKLERPTEDVMVLHLRTPRSKTLRFLAGQHVTIEIEGLQPRNQSIASCPCNGMILQFHVRGISGDAFSDYVFHRLKARQKVDIEGPFGHFALDEASRRPIIFMAYETGFAPIKSLIEHAIALELPQPMRLYWVARNENDHYLANYCRSWRDVLDDFQFTAISAESAAGMDAFVRNELHAGIAQLARAERDMLCAAVRVIDDCPDLSEFDVYTNGPASILGATKALLLKHHLPTDRLFVDDLEKF